MKVAVNQAPVVKRPKLITGYLNIWFKNGGRKTSTMLLLMHICGMCMRYLPSTKYIPSTRYLLKTKCVEGTTKFPF